MNKLQKTLKAIDENLNKIQPRTMDELIDVTHRTEGAGNYGTSFSIVKFKGYLQGVRVHVTGRTKTYTLPTGGKVYSVFKGVDKYEAAGYQVINQ